MAHQPCGSITPEIESPLQFERADPLLAGTNYTNRQQPFVQRCVRVLQQRSYGDRKLAPAREALVEALSGVRL